jgi:N utilization substance protein A
MSQKNNTELIAAIYQIAEERGLDQKMVLDQVKKSYLTAYKKMVREEVAMPIVEEEDEESSSLSVDIDENGDIFVLADKKVVSVISDQKTQILESQAKLIDPRLREGDHIQIDVTPENFGRIAAQAAYQRLMQGLRDAELETTMEKYLDKVGKIITGIIQRKDANYVRVEVDRAEAIMPLNEIIPGEFYRSSDRKRFLLVRLQNTVTDKRMVLSRGSADFLRALFEMEVPEVSSGSVELMNISREAGSRSKVSVRSLHEKVDAIGSCVGPRGTRIDSIMNEISPEKVDIILYDENIKNYVMNALSPAKVIGIKTDEETNSAVVLVEEDMLSLAIGKDGQNVRLAAKLTGYKIDITANKEEFDSPEATEVRKDRVEATKIENAPSGELTTGLESYGFTDRQVKALNTANISNREDLEKIASGETEVEGFTKRDIEKVKKSLE